MFEKITCDVLVVGSGPGGSNTAYLLAKAGKDVVLTEEGRRFSAGQTQPYSLGEMSAKYRNAGITPALGVPKVVYLEACCVGGASEINAALYHRPISSVLDQWRLDYQIEDMSLAALEPFLASCEKDIPVFPCPGGVGPTSRKIKEGADKLGWENEEVPRVWDYSQDRSRGVRRSMSDTLIPKMLENGGRLMDRTRIMKLVSKRGRAEYAIGYHHGENGQCEIVHVHFKEVFICAGAIRTPLILRRSGIRRNIGNALMMHPAVRVVAEFDEEVNDHANEGVPVQQVQEFKPWITLGGAYCGVPHLALWLADRDDMPQKVKRWKNLAMFYALIKGSGKGTVRNVPFFNEPLVRLPVTQQDAGLMGEGLTHLGQLLFTVKAKRIFAPIRGLPALESEQDLKVFEEGVPVDRTDISTIHLFCSCPMGEDKNKCAVDSYGKLHGANNIYLNDASILPDAPGVNPQATIMAIARRNTARFLAGS